MAKYRIWWQSSVQISLLPGYKEAVEAHAKEILGEDFEVEMHGVETSLNANQWTCCEMLNNRDLMGELFKAQDEGFDCIAIGCFGDPALQEAREVLDIPVVAIAETAMMWAKLYGASASIISTEEIANGKKFAALLREYDAVNFANFTMCKMSLEAMAKALSDPKDAMKLFTAACEKAAADGAEVIIPGCGLLAALSAMEQYSQVGDTGAIVLDVTGALLKTAEAAVILHKKCGVMTSRRGKYRKPDDAFIQKVRQKYGLA